jgi:hypothetical protein
MKPVFKKDSVWMGLGIGLCLPLIVYGILFLLYEFLDTIGVFSDIGFAEDFRTRTLALIAICSNLILMQTYRRAHLYNETIRGILIGSMILVVIWFFKFGIKILQF